MDHISCFFCFLGFGFINFDPQRNEFPMVFKICPGELKALAVCGCNLNLGLSTICAGYLALRKEKHLINLLNTITNFWVKSILFVENL